MKRKEFIGKLGIGAAFVLTSTCILSCSKDETGGSVATEVDLTINISDYSELSNNGGYIIKDQIVIAKDTSGNFVAATQICSHEDKKEIIYSQDEWYCTDHGARFDLNGNGLNSHGSKGLTIYKTELSGDLLRIYS